MTRKTLRTKRAEGQRRIFKDKIFVGHDAEAQALRWSFDMEFDGWNCSRISKLGLSGVGVEKMFVCLVWKWVDA